MSITTMFMDACGSACYKPTHDDNNKFIIENVFTNSLNVLGYIPGISTISGIVRMIFAELMLQYTSDDDHDAIRHYQRHVARGVFETVPVIGNIIMIVCDSVYAIFLEWEENGRKKPDVQKTAGWYDL